MNETTNESKESSDEDDALEFDEDDDHDLQREYIMHTSAMRELKKEEGSDFWRYQSSQQVARSHARAAGDGYFN